MRSFVLIQGYVNRPEGAILSNPITLNSVNEHPDLTDAFDIIWQGLLGIYEAYKGNYADGAKKVLNAFEKIFSGSDEVAERNSELEILSDGSVSGLSGLPAGLKPTNLQISFAAWSEDDLKNDRSFGRSVPTDGVYDAVNRSWTDNNDIHHYQRTFDLEIAKLKAGQYAFGFGAVDDGWFFDVGVVSNLLVTVKQPTVRGWVLPISRRSLAIAARPEILKTPAPRPLRVGGVPKRTDPRPARREPVPGTAEVVSTLTRELAPVHHE